MLVRRRLTQQVRQVQVVMVLQHQSLVHPLLMQAAEAEAEAVVVVTQVQQVDQVAVEQVLRVVAHQLMQQQQELPILVVVAVVLLIPLQLEQQAVAELLLLNTQ